MSEPTLRERILDAALGLLREGGLKKFGQTQIAKAAGIPQGHLTYYFPRKADLVLAVARRSLDITAQASATLQAATPHTPERRKALLPVIASLVRDRQRTRMLLGLVVESEENDELRGLVREQGEMTRRLTANAFDLPENGPESVAAQALLWGLGLRNALVEEGEKDDVEQVLEMLLTWVECAKTGAKTA